MIRVKIYTFEGYATGPDGHTLVGVDGRPLLKFPYISRDVYDLEAADESVVLQSDSFPRGTRIAMIEAAPGTMVHYEVNPPNRKQDADLGSPSFYGTSPQVVAVGPEWSISFLAQWITSSEL